ncbi:Uncharacterised protein [Serratia fonticola]|uniref:Uncharacterized protein n=1 Tax=Serratia fonticola TaxID=47917 RepID=A0A4U9UT04_SERFO|nr:Uncharacterised protein [Serratia fonticola]VTR32841.1 Uncharacterised protein [Serratia fonticola]
MPHSKCEDEINFPDFLSHILQTLLPLNKSLQKSVPIELSQDY